MENLFKKTLILSCFVFVCQISGYAQLKKGDLGIYKGKIPAYKIKVGADSIPVTETPIEINLKKDSINIKIGEHTNSGVYTIVLERKTYFMLNCTMNNEVANERIIVYKKGKNIMREGIKPQADAELKKK